jgi:hypothetical protein
LARERAASRVDGGAEAAPDAGPPTRIDTFMIRLSTTSRKKLRDTHSGGAISISDAPSTSASNRQRFRLVWPESTPADFFPSFFAQLSINTSGPTPILLV